MEELLKQIKDKQQESLESQVKQKLDEQAPASPVGNAESFDASRISSQKPVQVADVPAIRSVAAPSLDSIMNRNQSTSQLEQLQGELVGDIIEGQNALAGRAQFQASQEEQFGVAGKTQAVTDLVNQFNTIQAQVDAAPLVIQEEAQGRGQTRFTTQIREQDVQRQLAIQQLTTAAAISAAQNDLSTAQSLADRAVSARYDGVEQVLNAQRANLEAIQPLLEGERSKRNQQMIVELEERSRILQEEKELDSVREQYALNAIANGAPQQVVNQIKQAESVDDVFLVGGKNIIDPQTRVALESHRESMIQNSFNREIALKNYGLTKAQMDEQKRQFNLNYNQKREELKLQEQQAKSAEEAARAQKDARDLIARKQASNDLFTLQTKFNNAQEILDSPYFSSAFGPNPLSKGFLSGGFSVSGQVKAKYAAIAGKNKSLRDSLETIISDQGLQGLEAFKGPTTDFEFGKAQEAISAMRTDSSEESIRKWLPIYQENVSRMMEIKSLEALPTEAISSAYSYYNQ